MEAHRAIVLAAGVGSRLEPLTDEQPKCLTHVGGMTILERLLRAFESAGLEEVVIVTGYRAPMIDAFVRSRHWAIPVRTVTNERYDETNNLYSFSLAVQDLTPMAAILCNADIVIDDGIVTKLMADPRPNLIACKPGVYIEESMKVVARADDTLAAIAKTITPEDAYGVSIDIYKFSARSITALFERAQAAINDTTGTNAWMETAIDTLLANQTIAAYPLSIETLRWVEVDNIGDLVQADQLFAKFARMAEARPAIALDMDGTTLLDGRPLDGACEAIQWLADNGYPYFFVSNNCSVSEHQIYTRLHDLGFPVQPDQVVSAFSETTAFLDSRGFTRVHVMGTGHLANALTDAGYTVTTKHPDCVVVSFDRESTYEKLTEACLAIAHGVPYVVTNGDVFCPTADGPIPDAGAFAALLETATGIAPLATFGKPNPYITRIALDRLGLPASHPVIVVGDRLGTDIRMAVDGGYGSILVLSGDATRAAIEHSAWQPTSVAHSVAELPTILTAL